MAAEEEHREASLLTRLKVLLSGTCTSCPISVIMIVPPTYFRLIRDLSTQCIERQSQHHCGCYACAMHRLDDCGASSSHVGDEYGAQLPAFPKNPDGGSWGSTGSGNVNAGEQRDRRGLSRDFTRERWDARGEQLRTESEHNLPSTSM